jgi:phosphoribosylanthranilate isomerase
MIVKICGITTLEDSLAALEAGANMLGFNFFPASPRFIALERCAQICADIHRRDPQVLCVGVFVNASLSDMQRILSDGLLDLAQCSGDEPPALLIKLGQRGFKALRPATERDLNNQLGIYPLRETSPAFLVDAFRPGEYGGTGLSADWGLASRLARRFPILLAGGLTPANVAQAVQQVKPWGVDVASGVEDRPGVKNYAKMAAFIQNARKVEEDF